MNTDTSIVAPSLNLNSGQFGKAIAALVDKNVTDIHYTEGLPLAVRYNGNDLETVSSDVFSKEDVRSFLSRFCRGNIITTDNLSFETMGKRVRVKTSFSLGIFQVFMRFLPIIPFDMDDLRYQDESLDIVLGIRPPAGIFIVNGAAGSGKSTFTTAFLRQILEKYPLHLITIEDPVEYVYSRIPLLKGRVSHREVPFDVPSFAEGVRNALREDPDIISVGEVRDEATAEAVVAASETGHFVICTVHASSHEGAIHRILGLLPTRDAARRIASIHLGGASMNRLKGGSSVIRTVDITLTSVGIRSAIIEDKLHQLNSNWDLAKRNKDYGPWSRNIKRQS